MKKDTVIGAILWAAVGFALLYALKLPGPKYNPLDGSWAISFPEGVPAMSWYGRLLWGVFGAMVIGGLRIVVGRLGVPRHPTVDTVMAGLFIGACIAWLVVVEWRHWIAT